MNLQLSSPAKTVASELDKRIAIIDDEKDLAEATKWDVEDAGFEAIIIPPSFKTANELASYIATRAGAAAIDHRLAFYGGANFYGATLVAALYDLKIPSVLITQYAKIDASLSIRKWKHKIPVVISRENANASSIARGIKNCILELDGKIPSHRRPHRTLVRITNVDKESGEDVVDAFVPGWNSYEAVRFPASLIPEEIRSHALKPGVRLFARVNIGADKSDDLYFEKFELAPTVDDNDELA